MRNIYHITDKYRINNLDDLNWCIQEGSVIKESKNAELIGVVKWRNISYHRDLSQASTRLAKMLTDETVCNTLNDYADTLQRHCKTLAQFVGGKS